MRANDIAIIGMSCQFAGARNLAEFWANLANGRDLITEVPEHRWRSYRAIPHEPGDASFLRCLRGAFLPLNLQFDAARYGVMPRQVIDGDPDHFFLIDLMDAALADAGIGADDPVRSTTDVFVGRGGYVTCTSMESVLRVEVADVFLELLERKFPDVIRGRRKTMRDYLLAAMPPDDAETVSTSVPNLAASRAANRLNLRGAAEVVDAACASSLVAVELAIDRLRNRRASLAIVSGVFLSQSPTFYAVFDRLGALSPTGQIRPLDQDADGLLVGEGGGTVVLKRWEDAVTDGDQIYAVIKGTGVSSDGRQGDVLAPSVSGQILAYERAYADAGVDPASIGCLEAHGTATRAGDAAEVASIRQFFGTFNHQPAQRVVGSIKSMIGHTMPASGMAALIKTALSLSSKVLPPSLHCTKPHPDLASSAFFVNDRTRPWIHDPRRGPRRAAVSSFGFGGINAHVVLEEMPSRSNTQPARRSRTRPIDSGVRPQTELLVIGANAMPELLSQIDTTLHALQSPDVTSDWPDFVVQHIRGLVSDVPLRLAVIASSVAQAVEQLNTTRQLLIQSSDKWEPPTGVFFCNTAGRDPGKVACILPGMGFPGMIGQYPRHLMDLCLHFPKVREQFDVFEDRDAHPDDPYPTSYIFCPPTTVPAEHQAKLKRRLAPPQSEKENEQLVEAQTRPDERFLAGLAVTLANWAAWVLIREFDIPVEMVTGQSQGELAAICAAGSADFLQTAPSYWQAIDGDIPKIHGQMAFVWINRERAEELIQELPGLELAIHISPEALILGGPREQLLIACERMQSQRILAQLLPYPPIHTSAMQPLRAPLMRAFDSDAFEIRPPQIALFSSITAQLYPDDRDGIRDHLLANLDKPLQIWQTLRAMYRDGARIFIQLGAGHMASQLSNFLEQDAQAVAVSIEADSVDALTQLQTVLAFVWTQGVHVNFTPLIAHRLRLHTGQASETAKATQRVPLRIEWSPLHHPLVPPAAPPCADHAPATPVADQETALNGDALRPIAGPPEMPLATQSQLIRQTGLPLLGALTEWEPGQRLVMWRTSDLDIDLFLLDHQFANARPYKPDEQCFPVAPLTFSLEALAEGASLLFPGKGLVAIENARAMRMLGLMNRRRDVCRIELVAETPTPTKGPVRVNGKIFARDEVAVTATIVLGDSYPTPPADRIPLPDTTTPWPWTTEQIYRDRFAFHGPRLQCIKQLKCRTNPLLTAELEVLPDDDLFADLPQPRLLSDPVVLDGVAQVLGLWCYSVGQYALPFEVQRLEYYSPRPPVGTRLDVRIRLSEFNTALRRVNFEFEVADDRGELWFRADSWTDWMFTWPIRFSEFLRNPCLLPLSDSVELDALSGRVQVRTLNTAPLSDVDPDWLGMILLHPRETISPVNHADRASRRHELFQRLALKESICTAARQIYPDLMLHPAAIELAVNLSGQWTICSGLPDCETWHLACHQSHQLITAVAARFSVAVQMSPRASLEANSRLPEFIEQMASLLIGQPMIHRPESSSSRMLALQSEDSRRTVLAEIKNIDEHHLFVMIDQPRHIGNSDDRLAAQ